MGQGHSCLGRAAKRGADSRHYLDFDPCGLAVIGFFAAATENEGVAALEAHHQMALARFADQNLVDPVLRHAVQRAFLGHRDQTGGRRGQIEYIPADETVMNNHIGIGEQPRRFQGQKIGIARTCANQIDFSRPGGPV